MKPNIKNPELHGSAPPDQRAAAARVIDANLNRSSEALRVIEDTLRFVLADPHLQTVCKQLRHDLGTVAAGFNRLITARDPANDVGRTRAVSAEYQRTGVAQILKANFARAGQSLRSLEEYSKIIEPAPAQAIETIRYSVYGLEKAVLTLLDSHDRLSAVRLCVMLDGCADDHVFRATVRAIIDGGAGMIQLRDKLLDDRQRLQRARMLVSLTRATPVVSIVNDRVDLAIASGADGVHLGQEDLTPAAARQIGGLDLLVGVSTHHLDQARQAVLDGANYIGVGPTFPSGTKLFSDFTGTALLEAVAAEISLPAFAIGGIHPQNLAQVMATGFSRVAVAGAVFHSEMPVTEATAALATRLAVSESVEGAR